MRTKSDFNQFDSDGAANEFRNPIQLRDAAPAPAAHQRQSRTGKFLTAGFLALTLSGAFLAVPRPANAGEVSIGISLHIGPPPIPVYTQPVCPGDGYMWTPGYWAFDPDEGYYWVPGTWVMIPEPGLYWTPGYWGWGGGEYVWHAGYWGPQVGFYGGVDYGYGYTGDGFHGGEWRGRNFYYNRSVANVTHTHITNVYYNNSVRNNFGSNRVSYNGGRGGLNARPDNRQIAAEHERRFAATPVQREHETAAHHDRSQFAAFNHGRPQVAATPRPGDFRGAGAAAPNRPVGGANPGANRGNNNDRNPGFRNPNPGQGGNHQPGNNNVRPNNSPAGGSAEPRQTGPGHDRRSTPPFHYNQPSGGNNNVNTPHGGYEQRAQPAPPHQENRSQPSFNRPSGGNNNVNTPHGGPEQHAAPAPPRQENRPQPNFNRPSGGNNNTNAPRGGNERPSGGPPQQHQNAPHAQPAQPHGPPPNAGGQHGGGHEPDHRH